MSSNPKSRPVCSKSGKVNFYVNLLSRKRKRRRKIIAKNYCKGRTLLHPTQSFHTNTSTPVFHITVYENKTLYGECSDPNHFPYRFVLGSKHTHTWVCQISSKYHKHKWQMDRQASENNSQAIVIMNGESILKSSARYNRSQKLNILCVSGGVWCKTSKLDISGLWTRYNK